MRRFAFVALLTFAVSACAGAPDRTSDGTSGETADSVDETLDTASTSSELTAKPALRTVSLSTGVDLQYYEQGKKNGEALIFLHGYTDSHRSFDLNYQYIPKRYHVYSLDQRGHGGSSKPSCCYEQEDFVGDVRAFMDALCIPKATIIGHSLGSFVAHRFAAEYPNRVDNLILIGSAPTIAGNPVALELKAAVDTLTDPVDPEFVRAFQASTFFRPIPPSFLDVAVSESLRLPADLWRKILDPAIQDDHTAILPQITAPTAIFWGTEDGFFGLSEQQALDAAIPDSTLFVYEGTGHGLHVEEPKRFVKDMIRFIKRN